jgi:hypothetical protein
MGRKNRVLSVEGLESRKCFSVDLGMLAPTMEEIEMVLIRHNHAMPTDVNMDGNTSPLDVLSIINELNLPELAPVETIMSDTNGDGTVSPLDALLVINRLNDPNLSSVLSVSLDIDADTSAPDLETDETDRQMMEEITEIINASQAAGESVADLLARLRDRGLIEVSSSFLESLNTDFFSSANHQAIDADVAEVDGAIELNPNDFDASDIENFLFGSEDSGLGDRSIAGDSGSTNWSTGSTYDPTDDNGNGYFLSAEEAAPITSSIEAELRRQLKLSDAAQLNVAVFRGEGDINYGTWRYLTEEGISIWGNWRKTPEELRLFLSNVEEENRIYGQYPDGSFLYFSWLENEPVGFYFTPLNESAVVNPVPAERYDEYFSKIEGSESRVDESGVARAYFGNFGVFDGVQPIESLISDLYAIQLEWNGASL